MKLDKVLTLFSLKTPSTGTLSSKGVQQHVVKLDNRTSNLDPGVFLRD